MDGLIYDVHIKRVGWYAVRLWKEALVEKMNHIACFEMPQKDSAAFGNSHGSRGNDLKNTIKVATRRVLVEEEVEGGCSRVLESYQSNSFNIKTKERSISHEFILIAVI